MNVCVYKIPGPQILLDVFVLYKEAKESDYFLIHIPYANKLQFFFLG